MVLSWPLRLLPNPKLGHRLCYLFFFCARALAHLVIVLIVASVVLATCGVKFCISLLPVTWLYTLIFIRVDSDPPYLASLYANTCRYSVDSHLLRKLPNSPFKWVVTTVTATCSFLGLTRIRDMDVVLVVYGCPGSMTAFSSSLKSSEPGSWLRLMIVVLAGYGVADGAWYRVKTNTLCINFRPCLFYAKVSATAPPTCRGRQKCYYRYKSYCSNTTTSIAQWEL